MSNSYGFDTQREQLMRKFLNNLPVRTPIMKNAVRDFVAHRIDWQDVVNRCQAELLRVKSEQEEAEY